MASYFELKLITKPESHLWNDSCLARMLAMQTTDEWHRGTYVRWAVTSSWSVIELCCRDALNERNIGYKFKEDINKAIQNYGCTEINWDEGLWKQVEILKKRRNRYVHITINQDKLWPDISIANDVLDITKEAVIDIYTRCHKDVPNWINNKEHSGWK